MEIKKGIFLPGVFNEDYHQAEGISNSQLNEFAKSPAHYLALKKQGIKPDTPAQRIGRAFHSWVLDGEKPAVVPEGINRRTKAGREEYAENEASNQQQEQANDRFNGVIKQQERHREGFYRRPRYRLDNCQDS